MQNKSKGKTARRVQGESNNNQYEFMEKSHNESIDELGFVVCVFERESGQLRVTAPKQK